MGKVQTAMIIDDDEDLGLLLVSLLGAKKILGLPVSSLLEAEECLQIMKPTYVFLDNSFPEGLGLNFIRYIKSYDSEIKVIMLTGDADAWIEKKATEEGADFFMRKPVRTETIFAMLDKI